MKKTIERLCKYFLRYNPYADYLISPDALHEDGTFADVNYVCESRSDWSLSNHLRHVAAFALEYRKCHEKRYADAANLSLQNWVKYDYRNSNWWHNDIGVPQLLMHTALFLGNAILPANLQYVLSRLCDTVEDKWTGANRNWLAENVICKGLLSGNSELLETGKEIIQNTIYVSARGEEGIQCDYSFAQHGMQLYNHGYGRSFLENSTKWAYILHGSEFAFEKESIDILTKFAINGTFKMFRNDTMDFQPRSRECVRGYIGQPGRMDMHLPAIEVLLELNDDPKHTERLREIKAHMVSGARMPSMESNNLYYCLDFMTHVKENYYSSVRWASENVRGGDVQNGTPVNSENILAGFGAYGAMCYLVSGREYDNIAPVWDWGMLPGTTTPHIALPIEIGAKHESTFVGGVSDGVCGLMAADMHKTYEYNGIYSFSGKKACFMFDKYIVHLGCELQTDAPQGFQTCYNQCLLNGDVFINGERVKEKHFTGHGVQSVFHNGIAYYNLDDAALVLDLQEKTGNWHKVYAAEGVSDAEVKEEIFLLYRPQDKHGDTYAYAVVPGIDIATYTESDLLSGVHILSNGNVQAVYSEQDRKLAAVYYAPGECKYGNITIRTDQPCILLYDIDSRVAYITEPEGKREKINIKIIHNESSKEKCIEFSTVSSDKGKPIRVEF